MIISMAQHASQRQIDDVRERIQEFGYKVHSIQGEERVVIGAVGVGDVTACLTQIEAMPGVESAVRISAPYKFVSREFRPQRTRVRVDGFDIGGDEFVVIAGPCSVERDQSCAPPRLSQAGARLLRAGATSRARRRPQVRTEGRSCSESQAGHRPGHHHRGHDDGEVELWLNTPTFTKSAPEYTEHPLLKALGASRASSSEEAPPSVLLMSAE
jgi:hypothetical protein